MNASTLSHVQPGGDCFDIYELSVEEFQLVEGSGDVVGSVSSELAAATKFQLVPEVSEDGTVKLAIDSGLSENRHYTTSVETLLDRIPLGTFDFREYPTNLESKLVISTIPANNHIPKRITSWLM